MRGTQLITRLALLLSGVAAAACATKLVGGDLQTLGGADWRLVELNGRAAIPAELRGGRGSASTRTRVVCPARQDAIA